MSQSRIVRLDREVNGPMPVRRRLTIVRQQSNRALLDAAARPQPNRDLPHLTQMRSA